MLGWWIFGGICIVSMIFGIVLTEQVRKHFKAASKLTEAAMEAGYFPSLITSFFRNPFTAIIIIPSSILGGLLMPLASILTGMTPFEVFKEIVKGKETAANNFMTFVKSNGVTEQMIHKEDIEEFGAYFDFTSQEVEALYLEVRTYFRTSRSNES